MSKLLIVGASARAAAASALRAGFEPWCADLFADVDLQAMVPHVERCPVERFPAAFVDLLRDAPQAPWIYTGGLENHPRLIAKMTAIRPLWGNGPDVLRMCRDPFAVERILREAGLPVLRVLAAGAPRSGACRWLRKPFKGSAGQGISFDTSGRSRTHFDQEYVEGRSMSAVLVRSRGTVTVFGVTEQLIGIDWLHAPAFRYCGNIGPGEVSPSMRLDLLRIGEALGNACNLRGLFGLDFIERDDRPWVVEVNPRYPASVEVIELANGIAALRHHRAAFDPAAAAPIDTPQTRSVIAKAIVYAPKRFVMPRLEVPSRVRYADVTPPGQVVAAGWPILTLVSEGDRETSVWLLKQEAERLTVTVAKC